MHKDMSCDICGEIHDRYNLNEGLSLCLGCLRILMPEVAEQEEYDDALPEEDDAVIWCVA